MRWGSHTVEMRGEYLVQCIRTKLAKFQNDISAAVTVEFVVTLPFLIGVLVFASQYGQAMQVRNALDIAARDAARYMARAPLDPTGLTIDPLFITNAQTLVTSRLGPAVEGVRFPTIGSTANETTISIEVDVRFPLLQWLGRAEGDPDFTFFTMAANETWPRTE